MTTSKPWLAAALAAAAFPALAQVPSAPIKPGLWEVRGERTVDGKTMATGDAMKNASPETRARVEALMKQRGLGSASGGATRICFDKASLDGARWQNAANCQTDYASRTAAAWKWHTVCPAIESVIDGEAVFASPESYTVRSTSTRTFRGASKVTTTELQARWLGADCGAVKPFDPKLLEPKR